MMRMIGYHFGISSQSPSLEIAPVSNNTRYASYLETTELCHEFDLMNILPLFMHNYPRTFFPCMINTFHMDATDKRRIRLKMPVNLPKHHLFSLSKLTMSSLPSYTHSHASNSISNVSFSLFFVSYSVLYLLSCLIIANFPFLFHTHTCNR